MSASLPPARGKANPSPHVGDGLELPKPQRKILATLGHHVARLASACGRLGEEKKLPAEILPWLRRIHQPTLIMHGKDDPMVPLINAKILAALIPNSELYVIDDGHLFLISRATEVAPVIHRFLADGSGSSRPRAAEDGAA